MLFDKMDSNGDDHISHDELADGMRRLYPRLQSLHGEGQVLKRAFEAADADGDGRVSRDEFAGLVDYIEYWAQLWIEFQKLDADQSNGLSHEEFFQGFALTEAADVAGKSPEELVAMFDELDSDRSGTIDL